MGYINPELRKTLKVHSNTALTLLFGALVYFAFVSRWGAITLHIASNLFTRRS